MKKKFSFKDSLLVGLYIGIIVGAVISFVWILELGIGGIVE